MHSETLLLNENINMGPRTKLTWLTVNIKMLLDIKEMTMVWRIAQNDMVQAAHTDPTIDRNANHPVPGGIGVGGAYQAINSSYQVKWGNLIVTDSDWSEMVRFQPKSIKGLD